MKAQAQTITAAQRAQAKQRILETELLLAAQLYDNEYNVYRLFNFTHAEAKALAKEAAIKNISIISRNKAAVTTYLNSK